MKIQEFQFPSDWKLCPIADAYEFTGKPRGLDLSKNGDEIPFFPMDQIPLGRIHVSDFTPKPLAKLGSGTYVENGDLMVAKITPSFENGKQGIVDIETDFAYATTEVIPVRGKKGTSDTLFLFYYLLHPEVRSDLAGKMEGSTGRQRLSKTVLGDRMIPLPSLPEQKKIAYILSTVQKAIDEQERIIQTTTELKKALMQKLFTEGLHNEPQKQTEIGPIPESWTPISLGELCKKPGGALQTGPFGSQLHKHEYQENGIAVVNPTHLTGNRINHENVPRVSEEVAQRLGKHRLRRNDILFARRGEIGRQGLVTEAEETWLCGTGCFLVRASKPFIDNRYLALYFATERLVKWLYSHAAGAIMPNLNNSVMQRLPVFYPDLMTQTTIIKTFATIEQKLSTAVRRQSALQDLFRTLLNELMTAKTRVNKLGSKT